MISETSGLATVEELERLKLVAEIAKLHAEAERANQEALVHATALRQLTADAVMTEMRMEEMRVSRDAERGRDFYNGMYRFTGPVDDSSVHAAIDALTIWDRMYANKPLEIIFNSPGGSARAGFDLYDFIQELRGRGHFIVTVARGWAASMGGILLQAGDRRIMGAEAYVLIHEIHMSTGGNTSQIKDDVEFLERMQDRIMHIFATRSAQAVANGTAEAALSVDQLTNGDPALGIPGWKRRDWWLDSEQCLRFGIVDEVR